MGPGDGMQVLMDLPLVMALYLKLLKGPPNVYIISNPGLIANTKWFRIFYYGVTIVLTINK